MTVEYFNFFYFLYLAFSLGLLLGLYFLLRNRSEKTSNAVVFGILFFNFLLHFLRLASACHQVWMPRAIMTVTPQNICAVSVLLFPWFFLSKKNILRDYMFYMGIMSGLGAVIIPIDALGRNPFEFEVMRFYISHILLWVTPLLMVLLKVHTLDYRRIPKAPLLAYAVLCVILVNEIILTGAGFVHIGHLFSNEVRNSALIFGPLPDVAFLGTLFTALTPNFFLTVPIGPNAGAVFYWPVLWLVIPAYIYFSAASAVLALPFEYKRVKTDVAGVFQRLRTRIGAYY
ncbi:MAG: hypothetical protein FWC64_10905 [Treponema sp.]|nr:hypothetical protein [Treponema sp.]